MQCNCSCHQKLVPIDPDCYYHNNKPYYSTVPPICICIKCANCACNKAQSLEKIKQLMPSSCKCQAHIAALSNQVDQFRLDNMELKERINDLKGVCECLSINNRQLSKRLEKLEQSREANSRSNKDLFERIEEIENRLSMCENHDSESIKSRNLLLHDMQTSIDVLEKRHCDYVNAQNSISTTHLARIVNLEEANKFSEQHVKKLGYNYDELKEQINDLTGVCESLALSNKLSCTRTENLEQMENSIFKKVHQRIDYENTQFMKEWQETEKRIENLEDKLPQWSIGVEFHKLSNRVKELENQALPAKAENNHASDAYHYLVAGNSKNYNLMLEFIQRIAENKFMYVSSVLQLAAKDILGKINGGE